MSLGLALVVTLLCLVFILGPGLIAIYVVQWARRGELGGWGKAGLLLFTTPALSALYLLAVWWVRMLVYVLTGERL